MILMNLIKQRIAIAEIVGWRINPRVPAELKYDAIMCWIRPGNMDWHDEQLPDYLNCHNAIQEAINTLSLTLKTAYASKLFDICGSWAATTWATPKQKCEAFLKVMGKWENE